MSNGQALTNLIIILVVFYFAAFFVAAEFAIVSVRKSALESALEAGEGNKRKLKLALNMVSNMNEYLSTTQVGVTTTGIILGWLGADTLATLLTDLLGFMPLNKTSIVAISAVLGVVILTYLEVVITEIVPKNISIDMPMKVMIVHRDAAALFPRRLLPVRMAFECFGIGNRQACRTEAGRRRRRRFVAK